MTGSDRPRRRAVGVASVLGAMVFALGLTGCGTTGRSPGQQTDPGAVVAVTGTPQLPRTLLSEMRPIGRGERFHPRVRGTPTGRCQARPGRLEAHLELFGANRVVLIAAGVGIRTRPTRCYGNAVTTDPTGIVHYRPGATLADVFRAWGEPLTATQMASFHGAVRYYLAGHRVPGPPPLTEHAEIVIEVGPHVRPHPAFTFPPGL